MSQIDYLVFFDNRIQTHDPKFIGVLPYLYLTVELWYDWPQEKSQKQIVQFYQTNLCVFITDFRGDNPRGSQ